MTTLLYLSDTYASTATAKFLRVETNERGTAIVLNQTIFYPQGGGQPADHGTITAGEKVFHVTDVRLTPEGKVYHFGTFNGDEFAADCVVDLTIDMDRRLLHARLHSAGHLIDVAVTKANIQGITPTKGYHFSEGPYVEYDGVLEDAASWTEIVESISNELVQQDIKIIAVDLSPEEAKEQNIPAPEGKSARFVYFDGYQSDGCGCGGTHVTSSKEIGTITIRGIKSKKGVTKIKYQIS